MSFQFEGSRRARADRRFIPFLGKAAGALLLASLSGGAFAQVSLATLENPYTQNFDQTGASGLPATGSVTWTDDSTIPGWYLGRTASGAGTAAPAAPPYTVAADTGSGTGGAFYSYGSASANDRALGSLNSNATRDQYIGLRLKNSTGSTITSLDVAYVGEQWRNGGNTTAQSLTFGYATGAAVTDPTVGTYTAVPNLDFTGPIATSTAATLEGTAAANRTAKSFQITNLNIAAGEEIMLRWKDTSEPGNDHGFAVDDVSVTPHGAPALSVDDVSLAEGNSGATTFAFTVSLSAPAPAGGVTFNIATADNTATLADNDYVQKSLTGETIPQGNSTYTFNVVVNGDTVDEPNETFFVNVTGVTGATVADGQGQGTIVNDDATSPTLSIGDASQSEGDSGTTIFTFTVSLSQPAGAGGVTFDIATADGSATLADNDYVQKSLTSQTIPQGSSSYAFDVTVNGDTTVEPNETFSVNVTGVTGATVADGQGQGTIVNDDVAITKIHDVQGNGSATPIPGATVTVEGVVTAQFLGSTRLSGFFLQEENTDVDADPATSEGIFVYCTSCAAGSVAEGQRVRVTGTVSEHFNMTEITSLSAQVVVTDAGNHLGEVDAVSIALPVVGNLNDFYEKYEGMLVTFTNTLSVSEFFELPRYGQIELTQGGVPRTYTEDNAPSVSGLAAHLDEVARRRVILDDDNNVQNSILSQPNGQQAMYWPHANGGFGVGTQGTDYFRGGDTVTGLTGVLHWSFAGLTGTDAWRVRPTAAHPVAFTVANPRPATPPDVGGSIRVVGMNLLNYFTTIDTTSSSNSGDCGPSQTLDCRGADSAAELIRQRQRASIVICTLDPDVAAFMELENTTPSATITDLLGAVNTRCGGAHPYTFANTGGTLGTDAIRVQIVYRTGIVSPVGAPLSDMDSIHDRPPTAQTFDVSDASNPAFGKRFTVVANHLKSKGSCPGSGVDADQGDGQGCWASKRTQQAQRTMTWITNNVIPAAGSDDVLLLGDFNSYASENPVTALEAGGYADMETVLHGTNAYSYRFDGEVGHLDYAFANESLQSKVTGADAWHINADEVSSFDYNDEIKDVGEPTQDEKPDGSALTPPRTVWEPNTPYRASDHDPVVVGLFDATDLAITVADAPDPVVAGSNLVYTVSVTNNGPSAAASATWSDTLPVGTTFVSLPAVAGWSCTTPAVGVGGTVSCSNASFAVGSATFTLTVAVSSGVAGGTVLSNTATIASSLGDSVPANNSATATTTVTAAPQGHLTISPANVAFGNQTVGTTSAPRTVTLGNDGNAALDVTTLTPAAAPFARAGGTCTATPISIAAGTSCTLVYTFAPTVLGTANQTLTVSANAPGSGSIALGGNGEPVPLNPPSATVTPTTLSFTVQEDQTGTQTLNIADAAGSDDLTFAIASVGARAQLLPRPMSRSEHAAQRGGRIQPMSGRVFRAGTLNGASSRPAAWTPVGPDGSVTFQADDGTYEVSLGLTDGTTQSAAIYLNRYAATGALTINTVSIEWPGAAMADGDVTGKAINLVAYYDADADGDPTNAVRLGSDTPITIAGADAFENYATHFIVPGAGDVYLGFVDAFATGSASPLYAAALDEGGAPTVGWVSGSTTGDANLVNLAGNDLTGTIAALSNGDAAGVWLVRGTASTGSVDCSGPAAGWLSASPASGTVAGGASTNVTVTADPSADNLAPGSYSAALCITTNDPARQFISVPVSLTVTAAPFVPCSGGSDEIFCDGFDGSGVTVHTDSAEFLTHVAAGSWNNAFADAVPGEVGSLAYASAGFAYTVTASSNSLYPGAGVIAPNMASAKLVLTFTGNAVTAVGGNFWAIDFNGAPTGTDVSVTLGTGDTFTFTTGGPGDFRGFTTQAPIASLTIDAPDSPVLAWPALDNLIVGSAD